MNQGRTVFSQLISFLPDREFRRCVERYQGDLRLRGFTCWDQYLAMAFAQLTYRESLRDIEACLGSLQGKLYHLGFRGNGTGDRGDKHLAGSIPPREGRPSFNCSAALQRSWPLSDPGVEGQSGE